MPYYSDLYTSHGHKDICIKKCMALIKDEEAYHECRNQTKSNPADVWKIEQKNAVVTSPMQFTNTAFPTTT